MSTFQPIKRNWFNRCFYTLARCVLRPWAFLFYGLRVKGKENAITDSGALLVGNHQSHLDPILMGQAYPKRINFLARSSLFKNRLLLWFIRNLDAIPIERGGLGMDGLKETLKRLKRGERVLVYPEGTRSENGKIQMFQTGFTLLIKKAKVPIVPIVIAGAIDVMPKGQKRPNLFGKIQMQIGKPIPFNELEKLGPEAMSLKVEAVVKNLLAEANSDLAKRTGER